MQPENNVVRSGWDRNFLVSLVSGACAGLSVDLLIFPLDTIKTRMQSPSGFLRSGGVHNLYAGSASVLLGAAPGAAAFFVAYDLSKRLLETQTAWDPLVHMTAASIGEVVACSVRVPVEVVKQRTQARQSVSSWITFRNTLKYEGRRGLYRGYGSTVLREIPFSVIQFPLWEWFKNDLRYDRQRELLPIEAAFCGAMAGGIAGFVTTPLDVAKTRIMLHKEANLTVRKALKEAWEFNGFDGVLAGLSARSVSLALGGFIFLGIYETARQTVEQVI
ncbi:S-adenosylmethionine mitochondrial carrier protein [Galendromus occidentalis]|uniref:S-adenosylmethionine mitochondrial carrier protein n=1 Tax=Galendromus occidentalis TaxID=34638 RepID=A0AAJ6QSI0_9ACAR|nr:S-adenosylmethionine mitochondrial carrier protein [Galendromus occidentalis]